MIVAAEGDLVTPNRAGGLDVNGIALPHSTLLKEDPSGRPMEAFFKGPTVIGPGQVLLFTDVLDTSYDGRYFGPLPRSAIRSAIVPILTWE